jgi:hypothetical protein
MSDRHPGGRPPFTPTEQQRQTVEVLVAHGNAEWLIAKVVGSLDAAQALPRRAARLRGGHLNPRFCRRG